MSSKLPQQTLGEIWALSDPENNGFLTKDGWYRAARLIGWMQKGGQTKVDESLVSRSKPSAALSVFELKPQAAHTPRSVARPLLRLRLPSRLKTPAVHLLQPAVYLPSTLPTAPSSRASSWAVVRKMGRYPETKPATSLSRVSWITRSLA